MFFLNQKVKSYILEIFLVFKGYYYNFFLKTLKLNHKSVENLSLFENHD